MNLESNFIEATKESLKELYLISNQYILEFNNNLTHLSFFKKISISRNFFSNHLNCLSFKNSFNIRLFKKVLFISFYDSLDVSIDKDIVYNNNECFAIYYMIKNNIDLNLNSEKDVDKIIIECHEFIKKIFFQKNSLN